MNKIPEDLLDAIISAGPVDWGGTNAQSDDEHVADLIRVLQNTRERNGTQGDTVMQGVYLRDSDLAVCFTGTSPNSGRHARIISSMWNFLLSMAIEQRDSEGGK